MKLIVGLGNPGPKYETTRHNVGFLAIDRLVERWRAMGPRTQENAEVFQGEFGGEKILLVKPQTFMNLSGKSVAPLYRFFQCAPQDLIVIHDEVDLLPFSLRFKTGGGAAGHNGIKSIDAALGGNDTEYYRVRIGVGKSTHPSRPLADHVLDPFTDAELKQLDEVLDQVADAVEKILQGRLTEAMNLYHRKQE